jgi:DNA processing protein
MGDEPGDDLRDLICLTMVPGVGPLTGQALLDRFKTAGRVLDASPGDLRGVPGVGPKVAERIARARHEHDPDAELADCRRAGVTLLARNDPSFPRPLQDIPDPPSLLYLRGAYEPRDELAIALVGSRRCSPYGLRVAERLAASLARVGLTVVSGLARGIDAAAHRGAIKAGGRTLAVLANGLSRVYPPEHEELADAIVAAGALVSEMPMQQGPLAGLFPHYNQSQSLQGQSGSGRLTHE